ncbi:hypothetical protein PGT21_003935 [Puccinia graminis f. sp. tritici]|uniref:NodB homology domain-containing protein n=1 Tax=Puccinia graminis f. sp. tritici TaxID=56615 RepID=A0A5B0QYR4_PUCGR|nr:hypothetical protein PGT21_003935 [Puccinia graminis f. sp. tritici]KAA1118436.1 hypothetical protein PGTUg99_004805 [Puccinia graminis f. sp. tritici]
MNLWILLSALILLPAAAFTNSVVTLPAHNGNQPENQQQQRQADDNHVPATNHSRTVGKHGAHAQSAFKVYNTCKLSKSFSLTFDDGPTEYSAKLDKTLEKANLRGTFFINGNNFGCIYDHSEVLVERFKKGHLIGSHTWSHVHLTEGTYEQINHQIELIERAMIKILGVKPLYFRPPYGEYNDDVIKVLKKRGYKGLILWSEDSQDSLTSPPSPHEMIKTYQTYSDKTIVLSHETHPFMIDEVVPGVIPKLKSKGFKLLPVADCLELGSTPNDWYEVVKMPGSKDESWTCDGTPAPGMFE